MTCDCPRYSLKGPNGERAYENRPGGVPTTNRFLELADIALGLKNPRKERKRQLPLPPTILPKMNRIRVNAGGSIQPV
jgi:hypothetical protein